MMAPSLAPLRRARALVLGASGFIGYWVTRALGSAGAHVTCAVRSVAGAERLAREAVGDVVVRRDLADVDALARWVPALRPDLVFNLAGYGVDREERDAAMADLLNHQLIEPLARVVAALPASAWTGLRLVHVGSALEYGTTAGTLAEDSPCAPTTGYGTSKLAGTLALARAAQELGLPCCTARVFTVYGPGEHRGRLLPSLLAAAQAREPLDLTDGRQSRDFAYVEEVAEGLLRLACSDAEPGEVVNVATGAMHPVRTFCEVAASIVGVPRAHLRFGVLPTRAEEMSHDGVSVTRLRVLTRWSPADDIAEGIGRTLGRLAEETMHAARAAAER
jgi:UDP-glucose 4-epimerase